MLRSVNTPSWRDTVCILPTRTTYNAKERFGDLALDLAAFSRAPDSFLRLAIENQPYPAHRAIANKFQRALKEISSDASVVQILNSSPRQLTFKSIVTLFSRIEDKVAAWGDKSRHTMALHAIKFLREMPEPLGDGTTAAATGFQTRFTPPVPRPKQHAAERPLRKQPLPAEAKRDDENVAPPLPIDAIEYHTLAERDSKAYDVSAGRNEEIAQLCMRAFEQHDELKKRILAAKAAGLPELDRRFIGVRRGGLMDPQALLRLPEEDQLRVILHIMERERFHVSTPRVGYMPLDGLTFLESYFPRGLKITYNMRRELLMSDYYLPAQVVGACIVAIQNDKIINTEVISTLTRGDVEQTKKGYRFVGVKPKTNQLQSREVETPTNGKQDKLHATSKASVRAFELLLGNALTIETLHERTFVPLVTCLNIQFNKGDRIAFSDKTPWKLIRIFCKHHEIAPFDTRYLRHLALQTHILSPEGDVYSAQALAGHASMTTTRIYIYTNVTRHLHLSNIRRFMDMLAASILWKTGRSGLLEETGLGKRGFNLQLLFPMEGDDESEKSAVDEWIESGFTKAVSIGLDELDQCAAQYRYYVECLQELPQQNPHRFTVVHVPRVLTCYALRNVILASPYASAYRQYERKYQ